MNQHTYYHSSASDRFGGEAEDAPEILKCGYTGQPICEGETYYEHDGMVICQDAAKRYAWNEFLHQAKVKTA